VENGNVIQGGFHPYDSVKWQCHSRWISFI
jgi:hypothetical protein